MTKWLPPSGTRYGRYERWLRRAAARQGYALRKARFRTAETPEYGTYMLVDPNLDTIVHSTGRNGYGLTLDDVEEFLRPASS